MLRKLFCLLSIACFFRVRAQEYIPLLDNLNEWHFTTCYTLCPTDVYYTDGDTIVGGKNYKILNGYHYISRTFLLREDLASKTVYLNLASPGLTKEYLLYDFSLQAGDSIDIKNPITPFPTNAGYYKVDSIVNRSVANGMSPRHFYLSPTPSNTISNTPAIWIEGVGSLSMITAPGGYPDINGVGQLSCFFKNAELFYSNLDSISGCEPLILGTVVADSGLDKVMMNTIIKDGQCEIYNAKHIRNLNVFDLSGKKLQQITAVGQDKINLDFSKFASGIYLIVAYSEKLEKKVFKIVVK